MLQLICTVKKTKKTLKKLKIYQETIMGFNTRYCTLQSKNARRGLRAQSTVGTKSTQLATPLAAVES
jgi:hypothetical protein